MMDRTPEDDMNAAEESLELADDPTGVEKVSDREFLERMARSDDLLDHDGETCGQCCNMIIWAEVAREMLAAGDDEDVVKKWDKEARKRWRKTKFYKLWQAETKAGRDPRPAFKERGWEP